MVDSKFENDFSVKLTKWITQNPWKIALASIVSAFLLASGAKNLVFSNDYRVFFGKDNPQLIAFEEVEGKYTKSDNVIFILTPKNGDVFTRDFLKATQELTKEAWQVPHSTRVDSITNFQHTVAKGDDLFVDDLVAGDPLTYSDAKLASVKKTAIEEPILKNLLITPKANVTGISVSIQLPGKAPDEVVKLSQFVRGIRDDFMKKHPEIEVRLSGMVIMNNAFAELGQNDAATLTPLMYLIMIVIMALLLRSALGTVAALGVIILSTIAAMGVAGHLGIKLTPPSAIAPTVILTLAIADSVHILLSMLQLMRKGWEKTQALIESMRVNMQAVFLTSITTIVGFLCLNFSDAPPYHDLGNIAAIGVALAFIYSITFLPALIQILPVRVKTEEQETVTVMGSLAEFVVAHHRKVLLGTTVLAVLFAVAIPRLELNDEFVKWFDKRTEFRNDADYLNANLTGLYNFQYSIGSGEQEGISDPKFMQKVEEFSNWWRQQPETVHVATYTNIMKQVNQTMHGDDESWYKLPNNLDLAAQYLLLYEMSLPFGLDLNNQMDIDKSSVKLVVTMKDLTSRQGREVSARGDRWLEENAPKVMQAKATGPSVMFSYISDRNIQSMIKGTIIALILITLLMMISLKSFKYGLISLLPNMIPTIMAFGLWSVLVGQAGMAISIVTSATLGIIVDDSVHFITKFLRAKREGDRDNADAVRYAFHTVGKALVVTSVVLAIGFGVLTYSPFLLNWSLGALSAMTVLFALFVDFFFLPAFLIFIDQKKTKSKTQKSYRELEQTL